MIKYDKTEIREALTTEQIFDFLYEWGGNPTYSRDTIISYTICHNRPEDTNSKKLYYYPNNKMFHCYTGCTNSTFDIFELVCKVMNLQKGVTYDLNEAVRFVAHRFGIAGTEEDEAADGRVVGWEVFEKYNRVQSIEPKDYHIVLKEYDDVILDRLNYKVKIRPWLNEGMTQEVLDKARIGFFPATNQITIPHFDANGRFIGLRGRTLSTEDAERFGKYRPVVINRLLYTHPLGMNLYNLNNAKEPIKQLKKAIIYESEKSTLLHASYFGWENNISVACCGSNISAYQIQMLLDAGAEEIVVAFDRQFQEIGDDEFKHLVNNLKKIHSKYNNIVTISLIFDKEMITDYKSAPIDHGAEKFIQLFNNRILL